MFCTASTDDLRLSTELHTAGLSSLQAATESDNSMVGIAMARADLM
jgi:hypothetical protein